MLINLGVFFLASPGGARTVVEMVQAKTTTDRRKPASSHTSRVLFSQSRRPAELFWKETKKGTKCNDRDHRVVLRIAFSPGLVSFAHGDPES